jgi:hypothetical protein
VGKKLADPKKCTRCGEHKPRSDFYPHAVAKNGVSAWCKQCTRQATLDRQKRDKESVKLINRRARLKRSFGMTVQQYDEMLDAQGGCCALCGSDFPGGRGRFVVDHCHDTGRVRGLLCNLCNVGLGALRDSPQLLQKAIHYLRGKS